MDRRLLPALLVMLAACSSSKSPAGPTGSGPVSGDEPAASANDKPAACANIELTAEDVSCTADSDCSSVVTGQVCPGWVPNGPGARLGTVCYDGAANAAGAARIAAILATVPAGQDAGDDFCDQEHAGWALKCAAGTCVQCEFSDASVCKGAPTSSDASVDGGHSTPDASSGVDASGAGCTAGGVQFANGQAFCCGADPTPAPMGNTCYCRDGQILQSALFCVVDAGTSTDATSGDADP